MTTKVTIVLKKDDDTKQNRESVARQLATVTNNSSYQLGVVWWQPLEFWIPVDQLDTVAVKDCLEAVRHRSDVREVLVEAT